MNVITLKKSRPHVTKDESFNRKQPQKWTFPKEGRYAIRTAAESVRAPSNRSASRSSAYYTVLKRRCSRTLVKWFLNMNKAGSALIDRGMS